MPRSDESGLPGRSGTRSRRCRESSRTTLLTEMGRIGHAFRKNTAGAFGPDLAKKLSQLVKMEKNVMRSMELVGRERMEVAVSSFFIRAVSIH